MNDLIMESKVMSYLEMQPYFMDKQSVQLKFRLWGQYFFEKMGGLKNGLTIGSDWRRQVL